MIRIFNHYIHRQTLAQVSLDSGILVLAMLALFAFQLRGLEGLMPIAGTHVLSLAAGMLVFGTASGIYQKASNLTLVQTCARAALMLAVTLPLTYALFALLPADLPNRQALQFAAMGGVAAVVMRRIYLIHWGAQPRGRARVLIFGAGPAAQIVGHTLRSSDPNLEIVGYLPGPNEKETAVPAAQVLSAD